MMAPIGRGLILASLLVAAAGCVLGFSAGARRSTQALAWSRRLAYLYGALMVAAVGVMEAALLIPDFSVSYVAHVGSRSVPTWVAIVSLWSSLEGSILFWGLVLGLCIAAAAFLHRDQYPEYMPFAMGLLHAVAIFFSFLIAGPANPFGTVPHPPIDGPGPNALLQNHLLMVVHPPVLYVGYVGMTVPFAFAGAALFTGRLGHDILRPLRLWLLFPWVFLSLGIVLGGWWAYEVLGWGGYWAWDPVENASLLPWLTATAALHSAVLVERRGILKGWTVTLILATYLLTILGTFMTRSGVFNSVHSFTQSDIGPTFLVFLAMGLLFSVFLLASRIGTLSAEGRIEDAKSRESAFLVNNLLLVMLTLTVLLGTVFPLIVEAWKGKQISVGEPYFNQMAVPLGVAVLFLMGVGPALPWGKATSREAARLLAWPLAGAFAMLALGLLLGARTGWLLATLFFAGYTFAVTFAEMLSPVRARLSGRRGGFLSAMSTLLTTGRRRFGGYVVHAGVALVVLSIAVSSSLKVSTEISLGKGQSAPLGPYTLTFEGAKTLTEQHRQALVSTMRVTRGEEEVVTLFPRMNYYMTQREPIGTPAVHSTLKEDIYLSVMSVDEKEQRVGLRAFVNPMVVWIWIGTGIMALGAVLALWPRPLSFRTAVAPSAVAPGAGERAEAPRAVAAQGKAL
jgi:cytochrome c-type biogenesis protein CcmF